MSNKSTEINKSACFALYCFSFIGFGAGIIALGPLIPYLSFQSGLLQTRYNVFFLCRSIGMILGTFIFPYLRRYLTFHKIHFILSIVIFVAFFLFSISTTLFVQSALIFFSSIFLIMFDMVVNICVLDMYTGKQLQMKMLVVHGMFGIGGLLAPIAVYLFQYNAYAVIGLLQLISAPFFYFLVSPQTITHTSSQQQILLDKNMELASHPTPKPLQLPLLPQPKLVNISDYATKLFCFAMFMYVGSQVIYAQWVSSFAVMAEVSTKQQATSFGSIFWISITFFRFGLAFVGGTTSQKLKALILGQIIGSIISIIAAYAFNQVLFSLYFSSIILGLSYSSFFPLLLTLPGEYGCDLSPDQTSSICQWAALAQGILSMLVGYLMQWKISMFYWSLLIIAIILGLSLIKIETELLNFKNKNPQKQTEMIEKVK